MNIQNFNFIIDEFTWERQQRSFFRWFSVKWHKKRSSKNLELSTFKWTLKACNFDLSLE